MIIEFDTDNTSEFGEYRIFHSKEEFNAAYPGTLPHSRNGNVPDKYPVLVFEVVEYESFSGRDIIEFFFIYDFTVKEEK